MSNISDKIRQIIIKRAKGFCEYCVSNSAFSQDPFDVDHISPIFEQGTDSLDNLALACHGCNLYKSIKISGYDDLSEQNIKLFNPRTDIWKEHFSWNSEFTKIIGWTPIGRVTITELKMNRDGLINQREILRFAGKHPPNFDG